MLRKIYITSFLVLIAGTSFAQKGYKDYVRSGNRYYKDSLFVKADVDYRKALELNPKSTDAMYNLANSLLMQRKAKEAMKEYADVAKLETDKSKLAKIYHNMGVILQSSKQYPQCIEAYKQSLKNNPHDDETRYNLALAQKLLKDQQQQNKDQDKNKDKNKDKQKEKQKQDDNKDKQDKDKQQQQKQQQQQRNQMSKQNAEQLLNAVTQDEKNIQDKVKKQVKIQGRKLDKDW